MAFLAQVILVCLMVYSPKHDRCSAQMRHEKRSSAPSLAEHPGRLGTYPGTSE